jgi:hypothetical protein
MSGRNRDLTRATCYVLCATRATCNTCHVRGGADSNQLSALVSRQSAGMIAAAMSTLKMSAGMNG